MLHLVSYSTGINGLNNEMSILAIQHFCNVSLSVILANSLTTYYFLLQNMWAPSSSVLWNSLAQNWLSSHCRLFPIQAKNYPLPSLNSKNETHSSFHNNCLFDFQNSLSLSLISEATALCKISKPCYSLPCLQSLLFSSFEPIETFLGYTFPPQAHSWFFAKIVESASLLINC